MKNNEVTIFPLQRADCVALNCAINALHEIEISCVLRDIKTGELCATDEECAYQMIILLSRINGAYSSYINSIPKYVRNLLSPINQDADAGLIYAVIALLRERDEAPDVAAKIGACLACLLLRTEVIQRSEGGDGAWPDETFTQSAIGCVSGLFRNIYARELKSVLAAEYPQFAGYEVDISTVIPTCPLVIVAPPLSNSMRSLETFDREIAAAREVYSDIASVYALTNVLAAPEYQPDLPLG